MLRASTPLRTLIITMTLLLVLISVSQSMFILAAKQSKLKAEIKIQTPSILIPGNEYYLLIKVKNTMDKPLYEASLSIRILIDQPFEVYNWDRRDHGTPPEYFAWLYYYNVGNMSIGEESEVKVPLKVLPYAYSGFHTILVSLGAYTNKSLTWESWKYSDWHPVSLLVINPVDSSITLSFIGVLLTSVIILASITRYSRRKTK